MAGRSVSFDIIANDRASKTLDAVGGTAEKTGGRLSKLGGIAKMGALGIAGLAAGGAVLGKSLFDTSVSMEAMGNKAKTVFGHWFPDAMESADGLAQSLGMTQTETVGLLAGFGDLLIPMGFAQGKALDLSKNMGNLTAALSQWSNGTKSAADVQEILTGALTGEYDSLKSLGVQIDAETIKTLLHAKGKDKLTGKALKQAEAEVALEEITRQSSSAIDAYDKGTNKLALSKNKLTSQLKTFRDQLAQKAYPILVKTMTWITDKAVPAIQRFSWWLGPKLKEAWDKVRPGLERFAGWLTGKLIPAVQTAVRDALPKFKEALNTLKTAFSGSAGDGKKWGDLIVTVVTKVIAIAAYMAPIVAKHIHQIVVGIKVLWTVFKATANIALDMAEGVVGAVGGIIGAMAKIPGKVGQPFRDALPGIKKAKAELQAIRNAINGIPSDKNIIVRVNGKKVGFNPRTGRATVNNKPIPGFADGGQYSANTLAVVGERGPELFAASTSGTIIPNHALGGGSAPAGGGGTTVVNIYPRALLGTKRDVMAWIDEATAQNRRGGTYVAPAGA